MGQTRKKLMTLSFKDFMVTPVEKGEDEYQKYRAHKRRRGQGAGSNAEYASTNPPRVDEQEETDEALSMSQRLAKSRQMKRYKTKIKVGRERAMRKTADMGRIKKRAQKHARLQLFKKLSKGKSPSEVPFAKRQELEKRLDKMKDRIARIAKRLIPQVRKIEKERRSK